ncbi:site-specific integrase, partial [Chryseobacterium arthrosphaerae]
IRDYILWVINRQFSRCYSKKRQLYETYTRKIENIFSVLQLKYKRKIQNFKNIGEDHIKKVIDKFSEKKDNHPLYYRNFLIIELLSETGIRAGELLNLKTFDILFNSAIVKIIQSDLVDSRANKPNLKNIQSNRGIAISNELVHQLEYFILTIRRITYKSKKSKLDHPYLFTSLLGRPLSKSSIQNLFDKINDEFPYFDSNNKLIKITPHSIRHTFSYSFIKYAIEEKEMEIDRAKDELRKICGWNAASTMPDLYAGKYIWEKANLHNLERIRKLYEK